MPQSIYYIFLDRKGNAIGTSGHNSISHFMNVVFNKTSAESWNIIGIFIVITWVYSPVFRIRNIYTMVSWLIICMKFRLGIEELGQAYSAINKSV